MEKSVSVVNELLVELFNDALSIEQDVIQKGAFKDISVTEIHTIAAIGMYIPKNMTEVAGDLGITVGTLTIAINNLVKKGYVQRKKTEKDRRIVQLELTRKGKVAYRIHEKFHSDMVKASVEGLSPQEEEILVRSLKKLSEFFKNKYGFADNKGKERA